MATHLPLNVWILTAEYPPAHKGGQGVHARELAQGLGTAGCSVTVLAFTLQETAVSKNEGVVVHFVGSLSDKPNVEQAGFSAAIQSLNEEFVEYGRKLAAQDGLPDIIHCQDWILFPAGQQLGQSWDVRIVGTVHLLDEPCQRWWGQLPDPENARQEQRYCREADAIIAVSQGMATVIADTHQVPKERLHVVHNGINAPLFQPTVAPEARQRLRQTLGGGASKIILFAGRLSPVKGVDAFFQAAAQVIATYPSVRYLVAGEPASRASAQMVKTLQAQHPELNTHVKMLGKIPQKQLALLYQAADLAVVSSLFESFGFAAAEAMAAGVPVVATQTGGLPEIITHEQTGLLVPLHIEQTGGRQVDVAALAAAQCRLLQDSALAKKLGAAGQQHIVANFGPEKMIQETLAVYHQVRQQPPIVIEKANESKPTPSSFYPWDKAGWFDEATAWVGNELTKHGRFLTGKWEIVRRSSDACVLRFPAGETAVYLKAVPTHYAHEPILTQQVAQQFPTHSPPILAIDPNKQWLLTAEMAGRPLYETFDVALWQLVMKTLAQIQIHYVKNIDHLLALGCFDRRLETFVDRLRPFQEAAAHFSLDPALFDRIMPEVARRCQQVALQQIPATLEHGDFHPNNIYIAGNSPIFFDWADGAVSHPFFSPIALLGYIKFTLPDMQPHASALRDAYLQPWVAYKPMPELIAIFDGIRPLSTLHYALNMFECWQSRHLPINHVEPEMMKAVNMCIQLTTKELDILVQGSTF